MLIHLAKDKHQVISRFLILVDHMDVIFLIVVMIVQSCEFWATCAEATGHCQINNIQVISQGRAARMSSAVIPASPGLGCSFEGMRPFVISTRDGVVSSVEWPGRSRDVASCF